MISTSNSKTRAEREYHKLICSFVDAFIDGGFKPLDFAKIDPQIERFQQFRSYRSLLAGSEGLSIPSSLAIEVAGSRRLSKKSRVIHASLQALVEPDKNGAKSLAGLAKLQTDPSLREAFMLFFEPCKSGAFGLKGVSSKTLDSNVSGKHRVDPRYRLRLDHYGLLLPKDNARLERLLDYPSDKAVIAFHLITKTEFNQGLYLRLQTWQNRGPLGVNISSSARTSAQGFNALTHFENALINSSHPIESQQDIKMLLQTANAIAQGQSAQRQSVPQLSQALFRRPGGASPLIVGAGYPSSGMTRATGSHASL